MHREPLPTPPSCLFRWPTTAQRANHSHSRGHGHGHGHGHEHRSAAAELCAKLALTAAHRILATETILIARTALARPHQTRAHQRLEGSRPRGHRDGKAVSASKIFSWLSSCRDNGSD